MTNTARHKKQLKMLSWEIDDLIDKVLRDKWSLQKLIDCAEHGIIDLASFRTSQRNAADGTIMHACVNMYHRFDNPKKLFKYLCDTRACDMNVKTRDGNTVLTMMIPSHVFEPLDEKIEWLIAAGANVNLRGVFWTPLVIAVRQNLTDIACLLLKHGADANEESESQSLSVYKSHTPLGLAAANGNLFLCKKLINAGARIWNTSSRSYSIENAAINGNADIVSFLVWHEEAPWGANFNSTIFTMCSQSYLPTLKMRNIIRLLKLDYRCIWLLRIRKLFLASRCIITEEECGDSPENNNVWLWLCTVAPFWVIVAVCTAL